jgi:hypothetical protein
MRVLTIVTAAILLSAATGACPAQRQIAGTPLAGVNPPNEVVVYLKGAERQAETNDQRLEIRRALVDLASLPVDQLRGRRYADYEMRTGKWTLATLLARYFVPSEPHVLNEETLYRDAQLPEARAVINDQIRAIDDGRQASAPP